MVMLCRCLLLLTIFLSGAIGCHADGFFALVYDSVIRDGDADEIRAFSDFKPIYEASMHYILSKDYDHLFTEIDRYVTKEIDSAVIDQDTRISMIKRQFLAYLLFLKGCGHIESGENENAMELWYLSLWMLRDVYFKASLNGRDTVQVAMDFFVNCLLADGGKERLFDYLRKDVFIGKYVGRLPWKIVAPEYENNQIGDIVPMMPEDSYDYMGKVITAELDYYHLLKPIAPALSIIYDPDNPQVVSLLSNIDMKAGFFIARKIDKGYGFLRMGLYYNDDLIKQFAEKYLPITAGR